MMSRIEDLRLFLRQMWRMVGLPGTTAHVVMIVVFGIALNVTALRAVTGLKAERQSTCERIALRSAARTELKIVRAVMSSTLKKIGDGSHGWCLMQSWIEGSSLAKSAA
jgi:hypothetical protein